MATLTDHQTNLQLDGTIQAVVATNSTAKKFIGMVSLKNTSTSNVTVTAWRLPSATSSTEGSGSNETAVITVPAGRSVIFYELMGHSLNPSSEIRLKASAANVVNVSISGTEE